MELDKLYHNSINNPDFLTKLGLNKLSKIKHVKS